MGSLSLLQGIFPTQGSNQGLPHYRWILYQLSHKGSPRILEWVVCAFSSRSSRPRNRIRVSCIAGGFFLLAELSGKPQVCTAAAAESLQSCLTLCDHIDGSPPGSSVPGILQARILEWVVTSHPGDLPDPGIEPAPFASPALVGRYFTTSSN